MITTLIILFLGSILFGWSRTVRRAPALVQEVFSRMFPSVTAVTWKKNGRLYKAEFEEGGHPLAAWFDEEGHWVRTETEQPSQEHGTVSESSSE